MAFDFPSVSVIIPTHNRETLTQRAVQSVLAQEFQDWELIVIDDGSSDGTLNWLKNLHDSWRAPQKLQTLSVPNGGVSQARNLGAILARSPWLAFLDSDDEWTPDKLRLQMPLTKSYRWIHGEEIWIRSGRRVNPPLRYAKSGGRIFNRCVEICCVSPSTVLIERALFIELNGFREDFVVCEDYELWLRLAAREPIGWIETPVTQKYGGHADQLSHLYHSMDHWRARALLPFLDNHLISNAERNHVAETLVARCEILLKGFAKHQAQTRDREAEVLNWRAQALSARTANQSAHSAADLRPRSLSSLIL